MKRENILLALAIVMGGGCSQDALITDFNTGTMPEPVRRIGGIPENQAVMLSVEEFFQTSGTPSCALPRALANMFCKSNDLASTCSTLLSDRHYKL